jgi:hypothetical protein
MTLDNRHDVTRQRILKTYDVVLAIVPLLLPKSRSSYPGTGKRVAYLALGGLLTGATGFALALLLKADKPAKYSNPAENARPHNEVEDKFDKVADEVEPYAFRPVADETDGKRSQRERIL